MFHAVKQNVHAPEARWRKAEIYTVTFGTHVLG